MNTRKVYKIVNSINDEIYVGSTKTSLAKRFYGHKDAQKRRPEMNNLYTFVQQNGWDCCRIVLIEEFPCENKEQQLRREQHWIDILKPTGNKFNAFGQKCEHNRLRNKCKDCGGSQICQHNKQRSKCRDCGGSSICEHNRQRNYCKECNNYYCEYCDKKYNSKQSLYRHLLTHFKL